MHSINFKKLNSMKKHKKMNKYNKMIKHHHFHCLSKKEKMCLASMIGINFMKGIFIGMYINEK
ncbi:hypothetical protein [Clostridium oceanicum]|uniref:Uncharacterized protein n=1 Tax=Clostridium oceanicum TaxID=1543 RepID=A0ABP3UWC7_9CLOT